MPKTNVPHSCRDLKYKKQAALILVLELLELVTGCQGLRAFAKP